MRRHAQGWVAAGIIAALTVFAPQARAQEEIDDRVIGYRELSRLVANTSIIWVDDDFQAANPNIAAAADLFSDKLLANSQIKSKDKAEKLPPLEVYTNLGGFAFEASPAEAEEALNFARENGNDAQKKLVPALSITSNMIVSLMDTEYCGEPKAMTTTTLPPNTTPIGVQRVGGGEEKSYGHRVWIVDSGLDNASDFINVDKSLAANCMQSGQCRVNAGQFDRILRDQIGHGTMIAGIIAARPPTGSTGPSLLGVAPNAVVVPIKIFGAGGDTHLAGAPLRALDHLRANASPGDLVNLSWGAAWLEGMNRKRNQLATVMSQSTTRPGLVAKLRSLADNRQLKIVVAAGNIDPAIRPSWVQYVMPGGAGSYPSANEGCSICTVSAVESTMPSGSWMDKFWWDSPTTGPMVGSGASGKFGSNYGRNPPDFAEPGVDVLSIWPRDNSAANQVNRCSGTSFAAGHLAGVLLRGDPKAEFTVMGDPDSPADKTNADPVGVATE